ncbi:hypothetical protein OQ252_04265 [Acetobacter farinalis]|uniref:Transposase n=1 Tax=Acetobacter farinalis TaxID=1260984 RepID=A0ABT3Q5P2_9PROT|nr:hypothetical protein [Acetobacter farinalis]MCX2560617.1 hypothetical protein [Acetobacter farinalis]
MLALNGLPPGGVPVSLFGMVMKGTTIRSIFERLEDGKVEDVV